MVSTYLCNPSVLDRLNPLCEPNGSMTLSECGYDDETLKSHPSFRLFMMSTWKLSRATRDRNGDCFRRKAACRCIPCNFRRLPISDFGIACFMLLGEGCSSEPMKGPEGLYSNRMGEYLDEESRLPTLAGQAPTNLPQQLLE
jgi:midasin